MQRTYFFKTKDGLDKIVVRGKRGKQLCEYFRDNSNYTIQVLEGLFVTTILTKFETAVEIKDIIDMAPK